MDINKLSSVGEELQNAFYGGDSAPEKADPAPRRRLKKPQPSNLPETGSHVHHWVLSPTDDPSHSQGVCAAGDCPEGERIFDNQPLTPPSGGRPKGTGRKTRELLFDGYDPAILDDAGFSKANLDELITTPNQTQLIQERLRSSNKVNLDELGIPQPTEAESDRREKASVQAFQDFMADQRSLQKEAATSQPDTIMVVGPQKAELVQLPKEGADEKLMRHLQKADPGKTAQPGRQLKKEQLPEPLEQNRTIELPAAEDKSPRRRRRTPKLNNSRGGGENIVML